jgi:hypothetical protein
MAFSTITIEKGEPTTLASHVQAENCVMICSVARGRVSVAVERNIFGIGEGGMWRVRSGEVCLVKNAGDNEAVIHVTEST